MRIVQPLTTAEIEQLQRQAGQLDAGDLVLRLLATLEIERDIARLNARCWGDTEVELCLTRGHRD